MAVYVKCTSQLPLKHHYIFAFHQSLPVVSTRHTGCFRHKVAFRLLFCCYVRSLNNIRVLREANVVTPFVPLHSDMPKPPGEDIFILPDEYKFIPRNKRAVLMKNKHNQRLNVEMLVVVDRKMMDNHGHENITTYVLTVLNMVRDCASSMQASRCSSHHEFPSIKLRFIFGGILFKPLGSSTKCG